jgi:protein SCO1
VTGLFTHRLFAPALLGAVFGVGAATVGFLLVGPGLAPWADTLLTACFGWDPDTRRYRLDALVLALLQPPLFGTVIWLLYAEDLRRHFRSGRGRLAGLLAPAAFVGLSAMLLLTGEITASGAAPVPAALSAPVRDGRPASGFTLVDHRGRRLALEAFRGRPVVVTFVYANCHGTCPILVERLRALEARLPAADVAYLAVSVDPERDTPESLAAVARHWEIGARWHLLTGAPAELRRVREAYQVHAVPLPDGEIAHDNVILMIDRRGRLAFTYRGLAHPEARQAADLERLVREPVQ